MSGGLQRKLCLLTIYSAVPEKQEKREQLLGCSLWVAENGRAVYEFARSKCQASAEAPKLLDIGCNKGFILAAAADDDVNVYGIELVEELILPFKNSYPQYKDNIFSSSFEHVVNQLDDNSFDMITAIDVVEHFQDPEQDLKSIRRILKQDGVFVCQTPDAGCKEATDLKCGWGALKPLEHLHLFDQENFTKFAKDIGFSRVEYEKKPFEYADGNFLATLYK